MNNPENSTVRHQLLEVAAMRPNDIKQFYSQNLVYVNGCSLLSKSAPKEITLMYRGRLKSFDAALTPFLLAGVDPSGKKTCGVSGCVNPSHVIGFNR
jgi:hypothetical protein